MSDFSTSDEYSCYEIGICKLLQRLGRMHPSYNDALTYQQRFADNLTKARRYGDTHDLQSMRAEILYHINALTQNALGIDFRTLCPSLSTIAHTAGNDSRSLIINTGGGPFVMGDMTIKNSSLVGRDSINLQTSTPEHMFIPSVVEPKDVAAEHPAKPLAYVVWQRPQLIIEPDSEVEVRVALISYVAQPIEIIEISIPGISNGDYVQHWNCGKVIIQPFASQPAIRFVILARNYAQTTNVNFIPFVRYQVSGETQVRQLSSDCYIAGEAAQYFVPFLDRDRVVKSLQRCLSAAPLRDPNNWIALVDGWGTGRSRTLMECARMARQRGFDVLEVQCRNKYDEPIRRALLNRFGSVGNTSFLLKRLSAWIKNEPHNTLMNENGIQMVIQYLVEGIDKPRYRDAIADYIVQHAMNVPLLIILDDLDQAPRSTFHILSSLAARLQSSAVQGAKLAVCVSSDSRKIVRKRCPDCQYISLGNLPQSDIARFTEAFFPKLVLPPNSRTALENYIGRYPSVIYHSLNDLRCAGYIRLKKGNWELQPDFDLRLSLYSNNIDDQEESGLDALLIKYETHWEDQGKGYVMNVLQFAAMLGEEFELELLQEAILTPDRLFASDQHEFSISINELIEHGIITQTQSNLYSFTSRAIWRWLFRNIQRSPFCRHHKRLADLLRGRDSDEQANSGTQIAHHLLCSGLSDVMLEAFERFWQAANWHRKNHQLCQTIYLCENALEAARLSQGQVSFDKVWEVKYELAELLDWYGQWEEGIQVALRLATECVSKTQKTSEGSCTLGYAIKAYTLAGWIYQEQGNMIDAAQHYAKAENLLLIQPSPDLQAYLLRKRATWHRKQKQYKEAVILYEQAVELPQPVESLTECWASYAELLRKLGKLQDALGYITKAMAYCTELPDLQAALVKLQAGIVYCELEQFKTSEKLLCEARDIAKRSGALLEYAQAESWLATLYSDINGGRPNQRVLIHYQRALELFMRLENTEMFKEFAREYIIAARIVGCEQDLLPVCRHIATTNIDDTELAVECKVIGDKFKWQLRSN
jgi:tetratricopeptide (TPR) repeat protein